MKVLLTGGNGFAGHHVAEAILKNTDWKIDIMDRLSYASTGYSRLQDINCYDDKRIQHFSHDVTLPIVEGLHDELVDTDYIIHMGAETHVDNSIENPEPFDFHSSRPGHDLRYGLDGTKLKEIGFSYSKSFEESLTKTIQWTLENPKWLDMGDTAAAPR
jgi:dTDP-D-glucose 4,6-dehydratase